MKILKAMSVTLMLLVLATAVPVAAIALDLQASASHGSAAAVRPSAPAPATDAALVIRHQVAHCHGWSYNGSRYGANHSAALAVGDSITVTNNDVMPQQLVQLSGPALALSTPAMSKMGATTKVTFTAPGTYVLGTKPGEDYTTGVTTTGADNVLHMRVVVS